MTTKTAPAAQPIEYTAEPTMVKFHLSDAFHRILIGPVRSGKSTGCCAELVMRARNQTPGADGVRRSRWAVVRNTYRQLEDSTLKTWMDWYRKLGEFNQRSMTHRVRFPEKDGSRVDSEIIFRALDRPEDVENLFSVEYTGAWVNEARQIPKGVIDTLGDRVGQYPAKKDGGCTWHGLILDTNPPDVDAWLYRLAEEEKPLGKLPDWDFFKQPGALMEVDGEFVPNPAAENIENLSEGIGYYLKRCQSKGVDYIRVYYCGEYGFVEEGKRVHEEYVDARHCAPEPFGPIEGLPIYFGQDFGLTPAAAFFQRTTRGQIRVFDEIATEDIGVQNYGDLLLVPKLQGEFADWKKTGIEGWGDPGAHRAETDEQTAFSILRAMKVPIRPASTNNPTLRREALALPLRRMIDGEPGLIISPDCVQLRKGLASKYQYRRLQVTGDERFEEKPLKNFWSHICEALEYGMLGIGEGRVLTSRPPKKYTPRPRVPVGPNAWLGM